ncbi:MAG TPA: ferrochelatase [Vicinamibacterales bacterium]|nr:ferrochelatase [Vicinamibacterales bacterium]
MNADTCGKPGASVVPSSNVRPFDAVLLISFGGPQGMDDIRPFLGNVLRGRNVPASRIEDVAHHYELFGGVSPITMFTQQQADGLQTRLAAAGEALPVFVGMRNWHPFLADTLSEMSRAGVRRALGCILAAQASYSSCQQYKENVLAAREVVRGAGLTDITVTYVAGWNAHEGFIEANAAHVRDAIAQLPDDARERARLVFTAHSIPTSMAERSMYREQLHESSRLVAERVGIADWALVYQSRSGRPQDPWLEPDIGDYLRTSKAEGVSAAVLCPIGFVCDHIEVLYDLDTEAAAIAREIDLPFARAAAVNADPRFLDMMADVCLSAVRRYQSGRPLPLLHKGVGPV